MMRHHAQAVEMAMIVYARTDDPVLSYIAYDIATTQQAQIGIMTGWLDGWGLPTTSLEPAMAWMGHPTKGPMPGMATKEEVDSLRDLPVDQMEAQFLRLMIGHHQGGVLMAAAAEELSGSDQTRDLAAGIATAQQAEIDQFQQMLEERGLPRVTDEVTLDDESVPTHSDEDDEHASGGHGQGEEGAGFTAGTEDVLRATLRYLPITLGLFALSWLVVDTVHRRLRRAPEEPYALGWRITAVCALMLSAMLHAGLTPDHFEERTSYGVFFAASVVVETAIAAAIVAWPSTFTFLAGAAVSIALIVVWSVFRFISPPGADAAESVDLIGLVTKAAEVVAAIACICLWFASAKRSRSKEQSPRWTLSTVTSPR
jgi:uncharacterized protein (DUF305 family)